MKKIKYTLYSLLTIFVLGLSNSCTNLVDDVTSDPDNLLTQDVDSKNVLQGVLLDGQFFQTSSGVRTVAMWLNQATGNDRQYVTVENWNNATTGDFDDTWRVGFNAFKSARDLQVKADKEFNYKHKAVGQIMEAYAAGTLTSLFGDIPYSEFDITGKNLTPKFDKQVDVYSKIQLLLDDAIVNMGKSGKFAADKDIFYNGSTSSWIKLAYSLKARFYLHVKNYPLAKTNALKGINSESGDMVAKFGGVYLQSFNPWGSFMDYDRAGYLTAENSYGVSLLDSASSQYRGNSKTDETARFEFNYFNDDFYYGVGWSLNYFSLADGWGEAGKFGVDTDMPLVTYGETLLIAAEADARISGISAGVTSYNKYRQLLATGYGLTSDYASRTLKYDDYADADFNSGGIENTDGKIPVNALLREIYQERYVYFLGYFESFTDFGRTNNIAEIKLKNYAGSPQRLLYSQVEINANPNVPSPLPKVTDKTTVNN